MAVAARDLMESGLTAVSPQTPVREVMTQLEQSTHGFVLVASAAESLLGVITWADLVRIMYESNQWDLQDEAVAHLPPKAYGMTPPELAALPAEVVMSCPVETVSPDAPLEELTRTLFKGRRKFVVVAEHGQTLGWVSRDRLIRQLLGGQA